MANALQTRGGTGLAAWVKDAEFKGHIQAMVGDVMEADYFVTHMMTAFQNPDFAKCSDRSKYTAMHECAALGLLPTLDQVRLIPYGTEIKAMPQWQGYKALMERHPSILEVTAYLVHKGDDIAVVNGELHHGYDPFDTERTIESVEDLRGGYCKIVYRDGRPPKYHYVTAKKIAKARACAKTQNVWGKWFEEMAIKTVYRDCYARRAVPMDPAVNARLQQAVSSDDIILGNDPARVESVRGAVPDAGITMGDLITGHPETAPGPEPEPAPPHASEERRNEYIGMVGEAASVADLNTLRGQVEDDDVLTDDHRAAILRAIEDERGAIKSTRGERSNGQ